MFRLLLLSIIISCLPLLAFRAHATARGPLWEVITTTDSGTAAGTDDNTPTLDVRTVGGQVYITVDRKCKVQVYTILGQLVTEKTVDSGTVRLSLGNRGIYILKTGTTTRRINL